jgi:hypothetical protein
LIFIGKLIIFEIEKVPESGSYKSHNTRVTRNQIMILSNRQENQTKITHFLSEIFAVSQEFNIAHKTL